MKHRLTHIIAGPCALESKTQLRKSVKQLKQYVTYIRASLWKPRTYPQWEGVGKEGIMMLLDETLPHGIIPATEIMLPEHARNIVQGLQAYDQSARILVWIGSRNQNHMIIQEMARILREHAKNILLMIKNQPWPDATHWAGLFHHVVEAGFPKENILLCHRGFHPYRGIPNPHRFRNLPDFKLARVVQKKIEKEFCLKSPMIFDPSHMGGSPQNVRKVVAMVNAYNCKVDGIIVEVHPDRKKAKTDAKQQISIDEFISLLALLEQTPYGAH